VLAAIERADGHEASRLYRGVGGGPNADYLIVSRWDDEAAFDAFVASDAFKKVTSWGKENILAGRPSHTTYREG
jgi:heme-degrading monooxygenase HmoA